MAQISDGAESLSPRFTVKDQTAALFLEGATVMKARVGNAGPSCRSPHLPDCHHVASHVLGGGQQAIPSRRLMSFEKSALAATRHLRICDFELPSAFSMTRPSQHRNTMLCYFEISSASALGVLAVLSAYPALAEITGGDSWTERKCGLYTAAWHHIAGDGVPRGVSEEFVTDHDAFLASGCLDRGHVCPRSPVEREIADMLSLMAVAEGMAGSFLPFDCAD